MRIHAYILWTFLLFFCSCKSKKTYFVDADIMPVIKPVTFQDALIEEARKCLYVPYEYGGCTTDGFDCSGFVQYVFQKQGLQLPRMVSDQAKYGEQVSINEIQQGDLIFFRSEDKLSHVGIITTVDGKLPSMIHSSSKYGVSELDLDESIYWPPKIAFFRRVWH